MVIADLKPIIQKQKRRENFCPDKKKKLSQWQFYGFYGTVSKAIGTWKQNKGFRNCRSQWNYHNNLYTSRK